MSPIYQAVNRIMPTPIAALALGLASLSWCWSIVAAVPELQLIGALCASVLLCLLASKFMLAPKQLSTELANPIVGSVLPTAAMATMVISVALPTNLAYWCWLLAVAVHLLLLGGFIWQQHKTFTLPRLIPGWFVPPIGLVTAVLTYPANAPFWLVNSIFWLGLTGYFLLLPLMLYRLLRKGALPDAAKPSLAVLAAPASLCLAAYLHFTAAPSPLLLGVLLVLALLMTSIVYVALPRLLCLPFTPAFAAYTFPLVIGATALFHVSRVFTLWQLDTLAVLIQRIAYLELGIATLVCTYVAIRFVCYIVVQWQQQCTDSAVITQSS